MGRLTNKVGPLPAWAWAAIPASLYVAYSYYRASQNPSAPIDAGADTSTGDPVADYGINNGSSLPSYGSAPSGSSNLPPVEQPQYTNAKWAQQAVTYLVSQGALPTDAVLVVNAYVLGYPQVVTAAQKALLEKAIKQFGPLPEGGGTIPTVNAPAPKPTPTPTPKPTTPTKPKAPTGVRAVARGKGVVAVAWAPTPTATKYRIIAYRTIVKVFGTETNATTQDIPKLVPGTVYAADVWAGNAKGWSTPTRVTFRAT